MLDLEKMRAITANSYAVAAANHFGALGPDALRRLIEAITRIYRIVEPTASSQPVVMFMRPSYPNSILGVSDSSAQAKVIRRLDDIAPEFTKACVLGVGDQDHFEVFDSGAVNIEDLSVEAVVYLYRSGVEYFCINRQMYKVLNPLPAHISIFARPTFSSLELALEDYRVRVARNTTCFILEGAWNEKKRILLKAKPERTMRRSLHQFLRTVFPEAEVRPEQIVDESHPVDIKVTWGDTNKRALIEIKWLGQSCDDSGEFTTAYTEARALSGAKQLAGYLDADRQAAPGLRTRGYLVVFDARRRGLKKGIASISIEDGLYYQDLDINYDPEYNKKRDDFSPPVRMFATPVFD